MTPDRKLEWDWFPGRVPENVTLDETAYLETTYSFELFHSREPDAVRIGRGSSIYLGVMFDLGPEARVRIGNFTLMNGSRLICDATIEIGDYCLISWNTVFMDTYRVPVEPALRRPFLETAAQRGRPASETGVPPVFASRTGILPVCGASSPSLHRGQDARGDRLEACPTSGAGVSPVSTGVPPARMFAGETPAATAGTAAPRPRPRQDAARPIHIGNNVWIGFDSCVLPGLSIGDGSIVGARSVVVEDVPPYTVVAGNPARVIRQLEPGESRAAADLAIQPIQLKNAVETTDGHR